MTDLSKQKCVPCEGGVLPFNTEQVKEHLSMVTDWELSADKEIRKNFTFLTFAKALSFVNSVGALAESEGHHPDLFLHDWNQVEIRLSTHAINGLSTNDFIIAAKIDKLLNVNP